MRFALSKFIVLIIFNLSTRLGIGSGYVWPGHVVLKLFPSILSFKQLQCRKGYILISGTNGKTTTAKLITHILEQSGYKVLNNKTGANLLNGLVTTILLADIGSVDYCVLEIDEFTLPRFLEYIDPKAIALLNLSRDQLDRYGETDIVLDRWQQSIRKLPPSVRIYADSAEPRFKTLSADMHFFDDSSERLSLTSLKGSFNAKNINAATKLVQDLGIPLTGILSSLDSFESAYGRGEQIDFFNKKYHLYLAKNPASFTHNLDLLEHFSPDNTDVLIILNDNIPDGRDVSWIYDIDPTAIKDKLAMFNGLYISGTRCYDMAVRLQYAGCSIDMSKVNPLIGEVVRQVLPKSKAEHVLVLPNYSAMLDFRKLLLGRKIL
ncbi:DUF1727 domain-containing protein [Candidatus Nomurabacteria bacterium]|uniref:DUF1727 domain-containing protein n=1 Tax=candidate division WWE3 bacterium TaxID=2053526 RepID=A0A955IVZ1_UNCKA|nr:DUF1727 domain-containing protein [candidate division WWE3 bacterium]MCB9823498.1 DUF1727 domain-containing protein [Candidatus Nomurabacteria bacterium]MCB9827780.1 DUF1727 domain-containing protein [Candidatus Nomurabacteria bacterium]HXK52385.1 MurT ligase domain-containing protein [bacterium]